MKPLNVSLRFSSFAQTLRHHRRTKCGAQNEFGDEFSRGASIMATVTFMTRRIHLYYQKLHEIGAKNLLTDGPFVTKHNFFYG
mmetsp:Transcript_6270/g.15528  ORF Transcript_6270/g.15528 Transcript_6270/m.15528 type:complete len:83 (-) Transcript_6270:180-428(-)